MQSAIYLIGKKDISEVFDGSVLPFLSKNNLTVPDRTIVPITDSNEALLFSLVGENLEQVLSSAILNAFNTAVLQESRNRSSLEIEWEYSFALVKSHYLEGKGLLDKHPEKEWVPVYHCKGGPYSEETTASKLFAPLALGYVLEGLNKKLEDLEEHLKELASTSFADFAKR